MHVATGVFGEHIAARHLRKNGYSLIAANYRSRFGEIDIIAQKGPYIVFVEVKTRSEHFLALPRESVTFDKQERIQKTAMLFLAQNQTELQPRFDVLEIVLGGKNKNKVIKLEHIENAF